MVILSLKARLFGGLLAKIGGPKWSEIGYRASKRALDSCLAKALHAENILLNTENERWGGGGGLFKVTNVLLTLDNYWPLINGFL